LQAVSDPSRYAETFMKQTVGSAVPTIVADIAGTTDLQGGKAVQRETVGVIDQLKSRIPGLRQTLPEKVSALGETVTAGNWFDTLANPFRSQYTKKSPEIDELRRLYNAGFNVTPPEIDKSIKINGESKELTAEEKNKYKVFVGEKINDYIGELISSPYYKSLSDENKSKLVYDFINDAGTVAKTELFGDKKELSNDQQMILEGKTGQDYIKLKQYKSQEQDISKAKKSEAQRLYERLMTFPVTERNQKWNELYQYDKTMANKVKDIAEGKSTTAENEMITELGVTDGSRAKYVYDMLMQIKDVNQRNSKWKELADQGVITSNVAKQIYSLVGN
jgi:hypothetical protein